MNTVLHRRKPPPEELSKFLLLSPEPKLREDAFAGRKALVVGALHDSIGAACAVGLLQHGCSHVVLQGESAKAIAPAYKFARELGYTNCAMDVADLSHEGSGKEMALRVKKEFPGIDIVLYISGVSEYFPYTNPDSKAAHRLHQINVVSAAEVFGVFLTQHLKRRKQNPTAKLDLGGCSSIQALVAAAHDAGFYSGSKAAMEQYLRGLGVQYVSQGVHTHCVAPGCVDTARHRSTPREFKATRDIGQQSPWGELAPPWVVSEAFLHSIANPNFRVGEPIVVDGGWRISGRVNATRQNKKK